MKHLRPRRGTQARRILDLLQERGSVGVTAREAIYDLHITRMAAIVHSLKKDYGLTIHSEYEPGKTARYWMKGRGPASRQAPPSSECSVCLMSIPYHTASCPMREHRPVEDALEGAE